jgi:Putative DNA-binding domain
VGDVEDLVIGRIDAAALDRLIAVGEPGGVERKTQMPQDGLGPSAAALANTAGGWILLGVRDDGTICGWTPPGNAHLHDYLRERLRRVVDPLPGFDTQLLETPKGSVGIIWIPASPLRPHVVTDTGVIYEREPGGKRPIDSQSKLLAMTLHSERAQTEAVARLTQLPMVVTALEATIAGKATNGQTRVADWIVSGTPLAVPPQFAQRVLGGECLRAFERLTADTLAVLTEHSTLRHTTTQPRPRGLVIDGSDDASHDVFQLTLDAGGVVVARWSQRLYGGVEHLTRLMDMTLAPLMSVSVGVLTECAVSGPAILHGYLRIRSTDASWRPVLSIAAADQHGELTTEDGVPILLGADLALPANRETMHEQVARWGAELGRHAGMATWR